MATSTVRVSNTTYFEYLDALRCLAFLAVFYAHTGTIFAGATVTSAFPLNIWNGFTVYGSYGVNFFFVLSGFLITFLLLKEKYSSGSSGEVSIRKFYRKRILRIWPVYFMALGFAVLILPLIIGSDTYSVYKMANPNMSSAAIFYNLFFSGNFYQGMGLGIASLSIGILWSVCVEEQFYLVWPWIVKWFNLRTLTIVTVFCLSLSLLYKFVYAHDRLGNYYLPWSVGMDLGFGALLGIFHFAKKTKQMFKTALIVIAGSILLTCAIITSSIWPIINANSSVSGTGLDISLVSEIKNSLPQVKSVLIETFRLLKTPIIDSIFILVIIFFINKTRALQTGKIHIAKRIKEKIFGSLIHLGKISYGLYAYHTMCLMLTVHILFKLGILKQSVGRGMFFFVCAMAMALTILVAELSFRFVEKRFLSLKK